METKRLLLRERTQQVQEKLLQMPLAEQLRFLGLDTQDQVTAELRRSNKRLGNLEMKWRKWEIIEKASQQVIGNCGFHNWYEEHERAEIGYTLYQNYRGKGYMAETLQLVIPHGFNEMGLNRIEAFVGPFNAPSIKVLENLGFNQEGLLQEHYKWEGQLVDSFVYALLKHKWGPFLS